MITTVDTYPSRVEGKPQILRRRDPVVAEEAMAQGNPLDPGQVEEFARQGYLAFPGFFSEQEAQLWHDEFRRLSRDETLRHAPETVLEPNSGIVRSIFAVHEFSQMYRRLITDPQIVDMVRQLLGTDVYIHQTRINIKPGFHGKEFYWHSDFETWHMEDGMPRMRAISAIITLTENIQQNGPLMLIPGSHESYVQCVGRTPERHFEKSLRRQEYGVPADETLRRLTDGHGIDVPTGPLGSLVLFECNTMHGSNGNITPYPRTNLFFVYNSVENTLVEPFCGLPSRPEYIGSHDFTPVSAWPA